MLAARRIEVDRDENVIIDESPVVQPRAWLVRGVRSSSGQLGLSLLGKGDGDGFDVAVVKGEPPSISAPTDGDDLQVTLFT